jgi:hypothetical protein
MLAWLQRRLRMPYARFAGASDALWGNAVLSRYPIVAGEVVPLPREGVPLRRNALRVDSTWAAGGASGWSSPTSTTSRGRLSGDLAAAGFVATTGTASDHRGIAVTVRTKP